MIKRASHDRKEDFVRPSPETIQTYMLGDATELERQEVIAAMAASVEFRREIREMAEEIDALNDNDLHRRVVEKEAPSTPNFRPHLNRRRAERSKITNIWKVLTPVAAAVVLLLVFVPMFMTGGGLVLVEKSVDPGLLMSLNVRGAQNATEKVYDTPKDAALAAFRSILAFDNGKFRLKEQSPSESQSGSWYRATLELTDKSGAMLDTIKGDLPLIDGKPPDDIQVWVLTMPNRALFSADMSEPLLTHQWDKACDFACVAFTYAVNSGYKASAPKIFKP